MHLEKSAASEFERRASRRSSRRILVQGGERDAAVDDGESDLDLAATAVSDGSRPRESQTPRLPQQRSSSSSHLTRTRRAPSISTVASTSTPDLRSSVSTSETAQPPTPSDVVASAEGAPTSQQTASPPQRPSSITKPPMAAGDTISRHDGAAGRNRGMPALFREPTSSTISEIYFGQEAPYRGPAGPSHPYGMYTQNVRATRTASVATASTGPESESSFAAARGPAHPYGMYPQATVDETTVTPAAAAAAIPVGFPGMAGQYQRRIGPDGEDAADIIGPDGHTEQLPPYTRYPDEAYARKVRDVERETVTPFPGVGAAVVESPLAPPVASPRASIAGAGGIGLATRNPEFEPADDLDSPQSRHSSRSFATDASHHVINTAATDAVVSEKQPRKKKARLWARRRLWGVIPYWAICLAIVILVVMVIVLGAVVGTIMAKQHPFRKSDRNGSNYQFDGIPTVTVTYDASPIPMPTGMPPLFTGNFSLPLMTNQVSDNCFNDTTQDQAWNCDVIMFTDMVLEIQKDRTNNADGYSISISCNQSLTISNNVYSYGEQPFVIPALKPMELVNDTSDPTRGPAWFTMVPFNKTVIVLESLLTPTASTAAPTQLAGRDLIDVLDSSGFKRKGVAQPGDKPWICTWPETFLEIFIFPEQNSTWDKVSATGSSSSSASSTTAPPNSSSSSSSTLAYTPSSTTNGATATASGADAPVETVTWEPPPPLYPKMMKIEERRVYKSPTPWCQQVEISSDGSPAQPVKDADGNDVVIYIAEIEDPPPGSTTTSESISARGGVLQYRDVSEISNCGCMWIMT